MKVKNNRRTFFPTCGSDDNINIINKCLTETKLVVYTEHFPLPSTHIPVMGMVEMGTLDTTTEDSGTQGYPQVPPLNLPSLNPLAIDLEV